MQLSMISRKLSEKIFEKKKSTEIIAALPDSD